MATQKIKKSGIDKINDFTWCRPALAASTALSCTALDDENNYIYYAVGSTFYRYSMANNSWNLLATVPLSISTVLDIEYSNSHGHYGTAISNGGGLNTIELAGLQGDVFVGKKIKIISGTGAGQERTITAVSNPIIKDRGVVTTASNTAITDGSTGVMTKHWSVNQWANYQVRVLHGGQANALVRPILYNSANVLAYVDQSWASITPWWGPTAAANTSATAGSQTLYQIESNIITVDSNWNTQPDSTSEFVILSGGVWLITSSGSTPFYNLMYYNVAADVWYFKTMNNGVFGSSLGTDVTLEVIQNSEDPLITGTITAADASSATDSSKNLTPGLYTNLEFRVTSGPANGQSRTLLSNTSSKFIPNRNWQNTPSIGDTYGIYRDFGKIYIIGNGASAIAQYDVDVDLAYGGKRFDWGVVRAATVTSTSTDSTPIAISMATYIINGIRSINSTPVAAGTGYSVGQILTIAGGGGGGVRILAVNDTGGVTQVSLEYTGSGYTTGTKSTTVTPSGGTGCTIDVQSLSTMGLIITTSPHKFKIGDTVTISGLTPSGYNGTKTIIANNTVVSSDTARIVFDLGADIGAPSITISQSATQLFDISKNWITNEHVGKLVYISQAGSPNATGVVRRITANTSNSLSFATITTAPTNGAHRYVIFSDKAFGTDESIGSTLGASAYSGRGRSGVATSGTTTSLTDSTKNWPSNYWSNTNPSGASNTGRKVRITKGTGAGTEMVITSNTATTLNFATQSFTPDDTSVYVILDCYGIVTTGGTTTLTDNTQNWGTNIWSGKRVRITGGTGLGSESVINSNTQTTLTIATSITTDTTSTYAILAPNSKGAGINMFDITNSTNTDLNDRYIYMFRGGGTNEITRYNIITEEIDNITYFPFSETLTTGSMHAYDGEDKIYFTKDATGRIMCYDIVKNIVINIGTVPYGMGTALIGNRMEIATSENGDRWLFIIRHSGQEMWRLKLN